MKLAGKRVLVTGAGGFIGSHLAQALLREGAQVRAMTHYRGNGSLDNLEDLSAEELATLDVIKGDIQDPYFVRRAVQGCDVVFHLAALIGIPYSYVAPASYVDTNVCGTLNLLEACRSENTPRVVHTSTSECYGTARYTPIDEDHPLQGQSPYSASKIGADKLVESYYCAFGVPVSTVRPFNTFGPRQSTRAIVPTIMRQLLAGVSTLRLGSLTPVRDLTLVSDTVNGFICAARADCVGGVYNLGTGSAVTIGDLARMIMAMLDMDVKIGLDEERVRPKNSEVMALISDNRKAASDLGWRPLVSLERGLRQTLEYEREHAGIHGSSAYGV